VFIENNIQACALDIKYMCDLNTCTCILNWQKEKNTDDVVIKTGPSLSNGERGVLRIVFRA
jgi:hypothetical protein